MLETNGYYDYCISESCFTQDSAEKTIKYLYDYGYRTIAINQIINEENMGNTKKKKKKGEPRDANDFPVPVPFDIKSLDNTLTKLNIHNFNILNRLTVEFSNQDMIHRVVKSPLFKKYHIIAALPTTQQAFMFVANTFEGDIVTYDSESKLNFRMNRKSYRQIIDRGFHFELQYSPTILDSTKRKNMIQMAHTYHTVGKSKNIIFSSGATHPMLIRNPYDIISLGLIFGLSELQSKNSISHCGRQLFINSVGRRHGRAIMFVENTEDEIKQKEPEKSVIVIDDESGDEDMDVDQPAQKKSKQ